MNMYVELTKKHQEEVNAFPMIFAFSSQQLKESMKKLGLEEHETNRLLATGFGGYIKKEDETALREMMARHNAERIAAIDAPETGDTFIYDMFNYELANHEYGYTGEVDDTLDALGYSFDDINNNVRLSKGLQRAVEHQKSFDY